MASDSEGPACDAGRLTFPEAICWIKWRSPEMLRDYQNARREAGCDGYMFFLDWVIQYNCVDEDIFAYTLNEKRELFGALAANKLTATARLPVAPHTRMPIPDYEFADLALIEEESKDVLRFEVKRNSALWRQGAVAYLEARLLANDVRKVWEVKSKIERKHELTKLAIRQLGLSELNSLLQKEREARVVAFVTQRSNGAVTVSVRFVRDEIRKANGRPAQKRRALKRLGNS